MTGKKGVAAGEAINLSSKNTFFTGWQKSILT